MVLSILGAPAPLALAIVLLVLDPVPSSAPRSGRSLSASSPSSPTSPGHDHLGRLRTRLPAVRATSCSPASKAVPSISTPSSSSSPPSVADAVRNPRRPRRDPQRLDAADSGQGVPALPGRGPADAFDQQQRTRALITLGSALAPARLSGRLRRRAGAGRRRRQAPSNQATRPRSARRRRSGRSYAVCALQIPLHTGHRGPLPPPVRPRWRSLSTARASSAWPARTSTPPRAPGWIQHPKPRLDRRCPPSARWGSRRFPGGPGSSPPRPDSGRGQR